MLKEISVSKLKIGMCVCERNPRPANGESGIVQYVIAHHEQLKRIQGSGAETVYVRINESQHSKLVSLSTELKQAKKVKNESIKFISNFMNDVRLGKQVSVEQAQPVATKIVQSVLNNEDALLTLNTLRNKDKYIYEHAVRVAVLLTIFSRHIGFNDPELEQFCLGGLFMDIGMSKVPISILKKPAKLSEKEYKAIQKHVEFNYKQIQQMAIKSEIIISIMTEHHERIDGSGYPLHKKVDAVSLAGQMAAIVDIYDACVSDRVYQNGILPYLAIKNIFLEKEQYNLDLVDRFIQCIGIYPVSSLVVLSNGHFALVIEQNKQSLLYPKIRIIYDSVKRQFIHPQEIQLSPESEQYKIVGVEDPLKWGIDINAFISS